MIRDQITAVFKCGRCHEITTFEGDSRHSDLLAWQTLHKGFINCPVCYARNDIPEDWKIMFK